jgi:hypothetical protein
MYLGIVFVAGAIWCDKASNNDEPQLIQVLTRSRPAVGEWIYYEKPMFHLSNNLSAKMFPLGALLILIGGLEYRHFRFQSKLRELERQIEALTNKEKSP